MTKLKNNAGVTIAELMVYIVLGLIVVGYALNAMTDMAKGYTRTRTVMKMQKDGRDAVQVMAREIANTGFKYYIHDTTVAVNSAVAGSSPVSYASKAQTFYTTRPTRLPVVYTTNYQSGSTNPPKQLVLSSNQNWLNATYCGNWNNVTAVTSFGAVDPAVAADSTASFRFKNVSGAARSDSLVAYQALLNKGGTGLVGVSKIAYFLSADTLIRLESQAAKSALNTDSKGADDAWASSATVTTRMALMDKVAALQFQYSKDGINWDNDPSLDDASLTFDGANERHRIKMIKIQIVVYSDKAQKANYGTSITIGDINAIDVATATSGTDKHLLRLYEKIVEIPNNGVLIN